MLAAASLAEPAGCAAIVPPMARYYFDVSSPAPSIDAEGLDLSSLEAARLEAVRLAGQLLLDGPEVIVETPGLSITVRDGAGAVFQLSVRVGALG